MYLCSEGAIITGDEAEAAGVIDGFIDHDLPDASLPYYRFKELMEGRYLEKQLVKNDFSLSKTAKTLQMQKGNLSRKLKGLGIDINQIKTENECL